MLHLIERWISAPAWGRAVSLAAVTGIALILTGWFVIRPQQILTGEMVVKNQQLSVQIAPLRHNVVSLISSVKKREGKSEALMLPRFTVMDFVQQISGQLHKWQPENKSAVLEVSLPWEKLPALFALLSSYRSVITHAFSVQPESDSLRLSVALDFVDEP